MRVIYGFIFILTFSILSYGQKLLTLDDAIKIALQRNTSLQKSQNSIKSAESGYQAAWGSLLPSVGAQARYGWTRSIQPGSSIQYINGVPVSSSSSSSGSNDNYGYSVSAQASLTLFDGLSNIANVSQSSDQLESARLQLENLKQTLVFQTINYYYAVINNQQLLKVKADAVTWNRQNLATITERNKLGAVTLADVYAAQVQEGNAELDSINTKNTLETAKSNLLFYLGEDVFANYNYSDSLSNREEDILKSDLSGRFDNMNQLVEQALNKRADYKSATLDYEAAQSGITVAKGSYFPILTNDYTYNSSVNRLSDLNKFRSYGIDLSLNIPIFEQFRIDNQVQIAEVNAMNKKVDMDDLKRTVKQNLQTTYLNVIADEKSLDVNKRNVEAANENLKITQEKYSLGSGTLLDVLVANTNYTNARTSLINFEFQYLVQSAQLKYYLGELSYNNY
jgi:outer membrane protein TolC